MDDKSPLSPENVSSLIEHVMKSKDPANVGLRKILKKKEDEARNFQLHAPVMTEFDTPDIKHRHLSEDDTIILELEKKVSDLQIKLKNLEEHAKIAEKNAFQKGRDEGLAFGVTKGNTDTAAKYEKKIDELQKKIADFLESLEKSKREMFANADHILLKLVLEIVKKVISCEVKANREYILSVIRKSISYIGDKERLTIRVAPSDFETASKRKDFWVPVNERVKDITIESDERITQGGCIVESNSGTVDARLGVQFDELAGLVDKIWESVNAPDQE